MSRSSKKGPYVDQKLLKKIKAAIAAGNRAAIKTWSRDSAIAPEMVGATIAIHNGKIFTEVVIREEMVGHRLGEFSLTRKFVKHGGKMQRELEAATKTAEAEKAKAATAAGPEAAKK